MTILQSRSLLSDETREKKEKKGKKKEPVVVVPPKDPTPGTAFLKDLIFKATEKSDSEPGWVLPKVWRATKGENVGIPTVGRLACAYEPGDRDVEDAEERRNVVEELRPWFKVGLPRPA